MNKLILGLFKRQSKRFARKLVYRFGTGCRWGGG